MKIPPLTLKPTVLKIENDRFYITHDLEIGGHYIVARCYGSHGDGWTAKVTIDHKKRLIYLSLLRNDVSHAVTVMKFA